MEFILVLFIVLFISLLIWILFGIVAGMVGAKKGEGCLMFALGFLLGPFGLLIALFSKGNRKTCPHCRELVDKEAIVCSHCHRELPVKVVPPPILAPVPQPADLTMACPLCGKSLLISSLKSGENYCPNCFEKFIVE